MLVIDLQDGIKVKPGQHSSFLASFRIPVNLLRTGVDVS